MNYKLIGKTVPIIEITLNKDEAIYSQKGGMVWKTDGIKMTTNAKGGILRGLGRMFKAKSIFKNMYTSNVDGAQIAFAAIVPGNIVAINMKKHPTGFILQKESFLCAEPDIDIKVAFYKRISSTFFGGEDFILQNVQGSGTLFLETNGDSIIKKLAPDEVLKVDTGNIVGFETTVAYELEKVKVPQGEEFFVMKLIGPGKVIIQSQNFDDFAGRALSLMPIK